MKLLKITLIALAAFSLGGCVSAPVYRPVVVPAGTPPPQVIYIREYPYPYYAPYPVFSWHIGIGYRHGWRR